MKHPSHRHLPSVINLNTFDVIARRRSISNAANELGLTQGAVSKQLTDLEEFIGAPLFVRTVNGLEETASGTAYLRRVRILLDELEEATLTARSAPQPDKKLRISIPPVFGMNCALPRLLAFTEKYRDIELDIATHTGPISLTNSSLDMAIVYCEGAEYGYTGDLLHKVSIYPSAAPHLIDTALPLDGEQLIKLPLIHQTSSPNAWPSYLHQLGLFPKNPMPGPRYGLLSISVSAAISGRGVALLPQYVTTEPVASGKLVILNEQAFESPRSFFLITPNDRLNAPAVLLLRKWLTEIR